MVCVCLCVCVCVCVCVNIGLNPGQLLDQAEFLKCPRATTIAGNSSVRVAG